jgi:hypothetical protein
MKKSMKNILILKEKKEDKKIFNKKKLIKNQDI